MCSIIQEFYFFSWQPTHCKQQHYWRKPKRPLFSGTEQQVGKKGIPERRKAHEEGPMVIIAVCKGMISKAQCRMLELKQRPGATEAARIIKSRAVGRRKLWQWRQTVVEGGGGFLVMNLGQGLDCTQHGGTIQGSTGSSCYHVKRANEGYRRPTNDERHLHF